MLDAEFPFRFMGDANEPRLLRLSVTRHLGGYVISGTRGIQSVMDNDLGRASFNLLLTFPRLRVSDVLRPAVPLPVRRFRIGPSAVAVADRAPEIGRKVAVTLALTAGMQNKEGVGNR